MPRPKGSKNKPKNAATATSTSVEGIGGSKATQENIDHLSRMLGISETQVKAMLAAQGAGLPTATSRGPRASRRSAPSAPTTTEQPPQGAGASAWSDFMEEEGMPTAKKAKTAEENSSSTANNNDSSSTTIQYKLPIESKKLLPGVLAQTGTLDAALPGRERSAKEDDGPSHLFRPTVLCWASVFNRKQVHLIATASTAVHCIAVDVNNNVYGWGRNEFSQLGLDEGAPEFVYTPKLIEGLENKSSKIVDAAVGKFHTVLVDSEGAMYAAGRNNCGQLGVGRDTEISKTFRRCGTTEDFMRKNKPSNTNTVKMVSVSCGELFSVCLDDQGRMYSAGSSEFGQLGNGTTGETLAKANKITFENCNRFELRSTFVKKKDSKSTSDQIILGDVRIGRISCGKSHTVAIEAPREGDDDSCPRVFSWGCGNFGCLGHREQADEYFPRLIEAIAGPLFQSNHPKDVACGASHTVILTQAGHVYYNGKHRTASDAIMYPMIVDALANNHHEVTAIGAGFQTVHCTTSNGQTVSWGTGKFGELGYGSESYSSSKPKFINALDKVLVKDISCGYGCAMYILNNDTAEDKKLIKELNHIEEKDVENDKSIKRK